MNRTFYHKERSQQIRLFKKGFFEDAKVGGFWTFFDDKGKPSISSNLDFILLPKDSLTNLYSDIRQSSQEYFTHNDISWWRQKEDRIFGTPNSFTHPRC